MVTQEEPVTAHQSWSWFHANPSMAGKAMGGPSAASWLQPQGPAAREKHSLCQLGDFPTLPAFLERVARRSESPKLPTSKQTPSGNCSCSSREPSWSLGSVFGAAVTDSVLFTPKINCGKYPNPTFSAQNNSVIKTTLAIINIQSEHKGSPRRNTNIPKSWRSQGLVRKHSLIFHNSKKV